MNQHDMPRATRYTILLLNGKQDGSFKTAANAEKMRARHAKLPADFAKYSPDMQARLLLIERTYKAATVVPFQRAR